MSRRFQVYPELTVRQVCYLMVPIWLLWTYIVYLVLTSKSGEYQFNEEIAKKVISSSIFTQPQFTDLKEFVDEVKASLNRARIGRVYRYLGGNNDKNLTVTVIRKQDQQTIWERALRKRKPACQKVPDHNELEGRVRPDLSPHNLSLVVPSPLPCVARHKVAIVIPYRDREEHLITLLNTLHPLLQRQQIQYRVYVVEQFGNDTFNKGVLMNAGVRESLRDLDFGCFVFHDVDLIPEDDRNMYSCPHMPRHMSVAVDKFNYTLPYSLLVGGVFSIRLDHFLAVNGYSNLYWGWGGEDDDMAYRIKYRKLEIIRPPETIARYSMIKHEHRPESPSAIRTALLRMAKKRSSRDGLNTVKYRVVWRHDSPSHTHLMIDIGRNHRWHFMDSQQRLIINF